MGGRRDEENETTFQRMVDHHYRTGKRMRLAGQRIRNVVHLMRYLFPLGPACPQKGGSDFCLRHVIPGWLGSPTRLAIV